MPDHEHDPTFDPFGSPLVPRPFAREQGGVDASGRRIGPYVLLEKIGQGGMGEVYKARRAESFEDRVAIKIISTGDAQSDPDLSARFVSERQSLAWLRHKHIATLLDGGESEDGVPYLVMELIHGEPIDVYCEQQELTRRERYGLFRQVCEAVEFAHHAAVVHRDIKPSNILVTAAGEVKLLDFGIAKVLQTPQVEEVNQEVALTRFRGRVSLAYASPEQIERALGSQIPVTIATDIYSLGILLCELLTGKLPLDLRGRSLSESIDIIRCQDPQIDAASDKKLSLEERAILSRMLQKAADDRYTSVHELIEDLDAMESGCPVSVIEYSIATRGIKAIKRHRVATLLITAGVTATLGIGAATMIQIDASRRARLAEIEHEQRAAIMMFLDLAVKMTDPVKSHANQTMVDFLLAATEPEALRVLEGHPEAEGSFKFAAGRTLQRLGYPAKAMPLLEEAEGLLSNDRGLTGASIIDVKMALAEVYNVYEMPEAAQAKILEVIDIGYDHRASDEWLASYRVELLMSYIQAGMYDEASSLSENLQMLLVRSDAPKLVASKFCRAQGLLKQAHAQFDQAEFYFREAIRYTREAEEESRDVLWTRLDAKDSLSEVLFYQGKYSEASSELEECERLAADLFGPDGTRFLGIRLTRAFRLFMAGEVHAATEIYEASLPTYAVQMGEHHPRVLLHQYRAAYALLVDQNPTRASEVLADVMEHLDHIDQPDKDLLAMCRFLHLRLQLRLNESGVDPALQSQVIADLSNPEIQYHQFVPDKVTLLMSDSVKHQQWPLLRQLTSCLVAYMDASGSVPGSAEIERLGTVLSSSLRMGTEGMQAAGELAFFVGEMSESVEEQPSDGAIRVLEQSAILLSRMRNHGQSAVLFETLARWRAARYGDYHEATLAALAMVGAEYFHAGQPELAEQLLRSTLAQCESHLSINAPAYTVTVNSLATVLIKQSQWLEAQRMLTGIIERASDTSPEPTIGLAYLHRCLAKGYETQGERGSAIESMRQAIDFAKDADGFPPKDIMEMQLWLMQRQSGFQSEEDGL